MLLEHILAPLEFSSLVAFLFILSKNSCLELKLALEYKYSETAENDGNSLKENKKIPSHEYLLF